MAMALRISWPRQPIIHARAAIPRIMKRKARPKPCSRTYCADAALSLKMNRLHLGSQPHSLDLDLHRVALNTGFARLDGLSTDRTILMDHLPVTQKTHSSAPQIVISMVTVRVFVSRRYSPKTSAVPARGFDSPSGSFNPEFLGLRCAFLDTSCLSCAMIRRRRRSFPTA